jgi:hypothetical protein
LNPRRTFGRSREVNLSVPKKMFVYVENEDRIGMFKRESVNVSMAVALVMLLGAGSVSANQSDTVEISKTKSSRSGGARDALPMVNPLWSPDTSHVIAAVGTGDLIPGAAGESGAASRAFGSFGIPYTTTRVQDGIRKVWKGQTNLSRLGTTYPYSTVGRFTFNTPNGSSYCSASLILRSVLVTAAHCLQQFGSHPATYNTFRFTPAYYGPNGSTLEQQHPYGVWKTGSVGRAFSWANGTDVGSGAARDNDIAVFIVKKKSGKFIGDRIGWMSYGWNNYSFVTSNRTGNLHTAATTTLGYPWYMDSGRIMQRADGPTYRTTVAGSEQLMQGSNFTGGSSGGPWVVNFSARDASLSGGAVQGSQSSVTVVGVTSWGSANPNFPKDNYSSQFGQNTRYPNASYGTYGAGNIGSLLNNLCKLPAPEGGTYESRGYCN